MIDFEGIRVGIDIGTSKTAVVISQKDELDNKLLILGIGCSPNTGVRKGKIVNIESTIQSIKKATEDAILMAGVEFNTVDINITGEIDSLNSNGIVAIARKDREVNSKDIQRVIEQARHINISSDKVILHVFPQYFKLDDQDHIKDPIGMAGVRLEGNVHLITAPAINIKNLVKCINKAGFSARNGIATGYASANSVVTEEDKESGILLLDIGAGTTDIMGFIEGFPIFTSVILVGGNNLTRDLAFGLKVSEGLAENIKKKHGCVYSGIVDPIDEIEVPVYGKNHVERISKQTISSILEPRAEEIFMMVRKKLEERNISLDSFTSGIVITGGSAKIPGIAEVCEKVIGLPTRIGIAQNVGGISDEAHDPAYSAALGLCMGEALNSNEAGSTAEKNPLVNKNSGGVMKKIGGIFKEILG